MSITVTPTTPHFGAPHFGAEISGLDLARPLKPAERDAILLLMDLIEHATQPRFMHSQSGKQGA